MLADVIAPEGFVPTTEAELLQADEDGLLEEGPRLEFKQELPPSDKASNAEFARDVASLAVSGGVLIIGVVDSDKRPPTLNPVPLQGLADRAEAVAASRCDPPVTLRMHEVPSSADPHVGYLVVIVPPSPLAPHMVGGRYYGRGERGKRPLADLEVARLIALREQRLVDARAGLDAYEARDPLAAAAAAANGRLFVVVEPRVIERGALVHVLPGGWQRWFSELIGGISARRAFDFSPAPSDAYVPARRPDGWALSTFENEFGGRQPASTEQALRFATTLLEIEFTEDGAVRIYCDRATDRVRDDTSFMLMDVLVAGLVRAALELAAEIGTRVGFYGTWSAGVRVTTIEGAVALSSERQFGRRGPAYQAERYEETTATSTAEILENPGRVVERLVGRLLRSMDVHSDARVRSHLDAPSS
jgi:hypothetical protein